MSESKENGRIITFGEENTVSADILRDFALGSTGVSVLATMQLQVIINDSYETKDAKEQILKREWLQHWKSIVQQGFREFPACDSAHPGFLDPKPLKELVSALRSNRTQCGLILLELVAFAPYFPFDTDQAKKFKKITADDAIKTSSLSGMAVQLGFPSEKVSQLEKALKSTVNSLTGKWVKLFFGLLVGLGLGAVTMGLAAPFIGGLIGASMGLSGAAATAAGLAAIGGGSLAAGGLGMAGGTVILVGGGTLLGLGAGTAVGYGSEP